MYTYTCMYACSCIHVYIDIYIYTYTYLDVYVFSYRCINVVYIDVFTGRYIQRIGSPKSDRSLAPGGCRVQEPADRAAAGLPRGWDDYWLFKYGLQERILSTPWHIKYIDI